MDKANCHGASVLFVSLLSALPLLCYLWVCWSMCNSVTHPSFLSFVCHTAITDNFIGDATKRSG